MMRRRDGDKGKEGPAIYIPEHQGCSAGAHGRNHLLLWVMTRVPVRHCLLCWKKEQNSPSVSPRQIQSNVAAVKNKPTPVSERYVGQVMALI